MPKHQPKMNIILIDAGRAMIEHFFVGFGLKLIDKGGCFLIDDATENLFGRHGLKSGFAHFYRVGIADHMTFGVMNAPDPVAPGLNFMVDSVAVMYPPGFWAMRSKI